MQAAQCSRRDPDSWRFPLIAIGPEKASSKVTPLHLDGIENSQNTFLTRPVQGHHRPRYALALAQHR